ncbi:MAG: ABC transporter ATP-binding protein [Candidatus Puniceispirillales bacterium]
MLEVKNLSKDFGGIKVIRNLSFSVRAGERRVILGPNGAGKTTLFHLLTGIETSSSGQISLAGQDISIMDAVRRARIGIARSYQKNNLFENLTIRENLMLAATAATGKSRWVFRDAIHQADIKARIEETAEQVALTDQLDMMVSSVSYGNRRQLEVGLALATKPSLLMMDEPTSGVGPAMIDTFHHLLDTLPRDITILIIEHDMDLAFSIADHITVLNFGEKVFEGTPDETRGNPTVRQIYLGSSKEGGSKEASGVSHAPA